MRVRGNGPEILLFAIFFPDKGNKPLKNEVSWLT